MNRVAVRRQVSVCSCLVCGLQAMAFETCLAQGSLHLKGSHKMLLGVGVQAPAPIKKLSWTIPSILAARLHSRRAVKTCGGTQGSVEMVLPETEPACNSLLSDDWCSQGSLELLQRCRAA